MDPDACVHPVKIVCSVVSRYLAGVIRAQRPVDSSVADPLVAKPVRLWVALVAIHPAAVPFVVAAR